MNITEIHNQVYYVGVNNRTADRFEELWPIPKGVSYNSYIIKGEKVALVDTVCINQCLQFLDNITGLIADKPIDYLIINHMEPDHSGSIQIIREKYPDIKIVGNSKTADMIKGYYGITENVISIKDGETLDLGCGKVLKFVFTPMVHWPETMMTYIESDKILFSGDAFGCYGALNGAVVDADMNTEPYIPEMYRYYSNIVAKYGVTVQAAMKKLAATPIDYICATHGPVWHNRIADVIGIYDRLSRFEAENGVVIAYGSMYGHTEEVAETIAADLAKLGIKNIKLYNLSKTNVSYVLADIMRYKGLIIGGPTYCNDLFPPVGNLVKAISIRDIKNRSVAYFGSYTWAPATTKRIAAALENLKVNFIESPFDMKQAPDADVYEACHTLARNMAASLD